MWSEFSNTELGGRSKQLQADFVKLQHRHTRGLHRPGLQATVVKSSHQLLRERLPGTETCMHSVTFTLLSIRTQGKLSSSHARMWAQLFSPDLWRKELKAFPDMDWIKSSVYLEGQAMEAALLQGAAWMAYILNKVLRIQGACFFVCWWVFSNQQCVETMRSAGLLRRAYKCYSPAKLFHFCGEGYYIPALFADWCLKPPSKDWCSHLVKKIS